MPEAKNTVTILIEPTKDDTRRVIEFASVDPPKVDLKWNLIGMLSAALCLAASALFHSHGSDDTSVALFSAAVALGSLSLFTIPTKYLTRWILRRRAGESKRRALEQLETDPHLTVVNTLTFDRERMSARSDRECINIPYAELTRFEEHSDCFLFEDSSAVCRIIPARFVCTADYLVLTALLREHCKAYKVVQSMRTSDSAQPVEPPVIPQPLAMAEYSLTNEEKKQILKLSPSCLPKCSPSRTKSTQQLVFDRFKDYSVALYEDCVVLRIFGSEHRYYYGQLAKAHDAGQFIFILFPDEYWVYPVPISALEDKNTFLIILSEKIEADREGAIQSKHIRADRPDTPVIEEADMTKGRVLLRARFDGKDILYRRRFGVTELVIDGKTYAQSKKLVEQAHHLTAWVDGIEYNALLSAADQRSYLAAGSRIMCTKVRIY